MILCQTSNVAVTVEDRRIVVDLILPCAVAEHERHDRKGSSYFLLRLFNQPKRFDGLDVAADYLIQIVCARGCNVHDRVAAAADMLIRLMGPQVCEACRARHLPTVAP